MSQRRIKGSYWVDFSIGGRRIRKRSPENTLTGARAYEQVLRQQLARGQRLDTPSHRTLADFAKEWLTKEVKSNNRPSEQRRKHLALQTHILPVLGAKRIDEVSAYHLEELKSRLLTKRLSPKTINDIVGVLRRCLAVAKEWQLLHEVPPYRPLKTIPPSFRFLSEDELQRLIRAAPPGVWRPMIIVGARTGMRFSELAGLRWPSITWSPPVVCVREGLVLGQLAPPKNNRIRYIRLLPSVVEALRALPRTQSGFVFTIGGRPIRYDTAKRALARIGRQAGLGRVVWHMLRHTFASMLVQRGVSLRFIQDSLGHSTMDMTQRYAHLTPQVLGDALSVLEPADPVPHGNRQATGS